MNLANIDAKVSELTKADSTNAYPTANRLINYNIWNQKIVSMIIDSQDTSDFEDANRSGYSTLSLPLVANQKDYRFGVSDGVIEVKRVDVTYDGVNSYRSTAVDSSELDVGLVDGATDVDTFFSPTSPAHDWKYNALFLYPTPLESLGSLQVEVSRTAKDVDLSAYTTGTATPGFDENFHPMVAYGMSLEYFIANGMTEQAAQTSQILSDYEARLRRQYGKKEREYPLRFQSDYVDYN